ncbi:hypothetical protein BAY06_03880 [Elizabethkingia anophelis]|uniref:hypothetical protein n=1 Tax=Elizabethkingia anophelis TaxID=1117645 RepID=UPI0009993244|nr:hypothetical protein [Elizabethkingia anophelis]OPC51476.1 hypothetical protein BAY06_03880 [Elizabethkingia anophelis]
MNNTRDLAYHNILEKLPTKRKQVLSALMEIQPACSFDIATYLGVPPNEVTGRLNELKIYGFIKILTVSEGAKGHLREFYTVVESPSEIKNHQDQILNAKEAEIRQLNDAIDIVPNQLAKRVLINEKNKAAKVLTMVQKAAV